MVDVSSSSPINGLGKSCDSIERKEKEKKMKTERNYCMAGWLARRTDDYYLINDVFFQMPTQLAS